MLILLLFGTFWCGLRTWAAVQWRTLRAGWAILGTGRHRAWAAPVADNTTAHRVVFTVLLSAQAEGGFAAYVPALPEVVTEGDTPQETLAMAEEAIRALLAYRQDMGIAVPADTMPIVYQVMVEP